MSFRPFQPFRAFGGFPALTLDGITTAAAYSVRKLRTGYAGACMRVRRSSDNVEADIGFTATGNLNTTALLAHCGAGSGFVTTWYDQSGNAINATQATVANQPSIVNAGFVDTINGKPAILFDGSNDILTTATNPFGAAINNAYICTTYKHLVLTNGYLFSLSGSTTSRWSAHAPFEDRNWYFDCGNVSGGRVQASPSGSIGDNLIMSFYCSTAENVQQFYKNGSLLAGDATGHSAAVSNGISIGGFSNAYNNAAIGDFIVINGTVNSTTRQSLERNQGAYYGIAVA